LIYLATNSLAGLLLVNELRDLLAESLDVAKCGLEYATRGSRTTQDLVHECLERGGITTSLLGRRKVNVS
jgi:hypothetical protein